MVSFHRHEEGNSLSSLDGQTIRKYEVQLKLKPLQYRVGWTHFSLYLKDERGRISSQRNPSGEWVKTPVVEGIHSRGGKGVKAWIEVGDYFPIVHFVGGTLPPKTTHLSREKRDQGVFQLLGQCVPPGGHFMFAYEVSYASSLHRETQEMLMKGFPPISTSQGELLFHAGCRLVKDWYLSEGGHEGPRKLWGETPLNEEESRGFDLKTFFQLLAFLSRKPDPTCIERERLARRRALEIVEDLGLEPNLSQFREEIIHIYQKGFRARKWEKTAYRACHHLKEMLETTQFEDDGMKETLSQISRDCIEEIQ